MWEISRQCLVPANETARFHRTRDFSVPIKFSQYTRTPSTRTPKGNEKQSELAEVRVIEVLLHFMDSVKLGTLSEANRTVP